MVAVAIVSWSIKRGLKGGEAVEVEVCSGSGEVGWCGGDVITRLLSRSEFARRS